MTRGEKTTCPQDLRRHVAPRLDAARLAAVWHRVANARKRRDSGRRRWVIAAAAGWAAAAATVLLLLLPDSSTAPATAGWDGTVLRTRREPMEVALADGTRVSAAPRTELALLARTKQSVRLSVRRGRATFRVRPQPDRAFIVTLGRARVRALGGDLTVLSTRVAGSRDVPRMEVRVLRGLVRVDHERKQVRLGAGERWSFEPRPVGEVPAVAGSRRPTAAARRARDAGAAQAAPRRTSPKKRRAPGDAAALFDRAGQARRRGEHRQAARLYRRFISRYGGDQRAGLAAFELGRLRMDHLGDLAGAAVAFKRALRAGAGTLRQDAMARLTLAYARLGRTRACLAAKRAYLRAFPDGRYAAHLSDRCARP